jgi:hypothetical protein
MAGIEHRSVSPTESFSSTGSANLHKMSPLRKQTPVPALPFARPQSPACPTQRPAEFLQVQN